MTACAKKEPPPERYTQAVRAEDEQERLSLKDTWEQGTTVAQAAPPAPRVVYAPPPRMRPAADAPPKPRVAARVDPPQRPARPDLAISAPPALPPPALSPPAPSPPRPPAAAPVAPKAPPKALTENDLQQDTTRCGVGVDCLALLQAMIADPKQSWMMQAPTPATFANGTRLFAYRALRKTLDCGRLRFAGAELEWAMDTFSRDVEGIDRAHASRVAALAAEVRGELEEEIGQRC